MTNAADSHTEGADLMVVYSTTNPGEAHIVAGRLESEDIPAAISQEPAGTALGIHIGILGAIRVLVRAEDYERAKVILDEPPEPLSLTEDADQVIFEGDQDVDE
ncbi:MAG: DUF2007 domain-containing protein [Anaerolineae bacterium]|nr:DUF2007 domain-containing protein [Anaerolineae bacterium]